MHTTTAASRRALLALLAPLLLLATLTDAFATGPAAPSGLRADVYSATAAELFWDRPDAFGLVYEVHRDGTPLLTTDGVSHFDDTLAAATTYTYQVWAVDRFGRRSAPASVTLTTEGGGGGAPAAPSGLRAAVYSATAAELFWDRPDAFGLVYEVHRDGTPLITTDGVGHFDDTLAAGTTYEYRVRAIDRAGRRSTAATVRLTTLGDGGTTPDDALVAPVIERIAVYSGTAAELFWQRPPPGSPVARVEVSRDNLVLGTTDGTSFFDDTRSPSVDYVYTLVAIDAAGNRSDGGAPDPGDGGDGLDTIRPDNAVALLAAVFDAYRGEPWGDTMLALPGFSRTPAPIPPNFGAEEEMTLTCDNGGSATIRLISVAAGTTGSQFGLAFTFDDCLDGDTLLDGQVDRHRGRWNGDLVHSPGITVTRPTETIRYSGSVFDAVGSVFENTSSHEVWTRGLRGVDGGTVDFERSAADGSTYSLRGADTYFINGFRQPSVRPSFELRGSLALTSARTGGTTLQVETPEWLNRPFELDPEIGGWSPDPAVATFTEGSLRASAPDGSTVQLEADNGDVASARLTIIDSAGERTSFDQPWDVWRENLDFD